VKIDGKQVFLSRDKAEAKRKWTRLMADGLPRDCLLSECMDDYLDTLTGYTKKLRAGVLKAFLKHVGPIRVSKLQEHHFESYVKPAWSSSTRRTYLDVLITCLNHAVKKKKIPDNPLKNVKKPAWERREHIMTAEELSTLLKHATEPFLTILTFMAKTGVRPGEACGVQIENCFPDQHLILVANKTAKQTGVKMRPVYVSDEIAEMVRKLMCGRTGRLFLNFYGRPWNRDAVQKRFESLREKLGLSKGVVAYAVRHRFGSDAINVHRLDSLIVARLMGHSDPSMLASNYFHEDIQPMVDAVTKIGKLDKS
jgi:integrase